MDPRFFRKFSDLITEAEKTDEGIMDTVKGAAQKVGGAVKDAYKTVTDPEYSYHKNWNNNKTDFVKWQQRIKHHMANNPGMTDAEAMDLVDREDVPADSFLNVERTFGVNHNSPEGKWLANNDAIRAKLVQAGIEKMNPQQKQQLIQQAIQKYGR